MQLVYFLFPIVLGVVLTLGGSSALGVVPKSIRFEAEHAHVIGSALIFDNEGVGCVAFTSAEKATPSGAVIFSANILTDGDYMITLRFKNGLSKNAFQVVANGFEQDMIHLPPTSNIGWSEQDAYVSLRQGLNTLVVKAVGGSVSLDYVEIHGGINLANRGATLPYFEIEAESAVTNGVVIGPGRDYMTLPSEASGRKAVQLTQGQYVEFTLTASANGLVVRFSIPDSANGSGLSADLGVLINGQTDGTLTVTSKFSWAYGVYPFSKNPGEGGAHHFYDEVRYLFKSTLAAGTKVRLQAASAQKYTIDLADFYTVPAPYSQPAGYLSVTTYGADPGGVKDSTAAFQAAIADAQKQSKGLWIGEGKFLVTSRFTVNKQIIRGAGPWYSTVQGTVSHGVGFFGNWAPNPSVDVQLYDFAITGYTNYRNDSAVDSGVGGAFNGNSIVQNVWIEHTKCGMWLDGPFSNFHVSGVTIRNTYADGINLHLGISNVVVEQSIFRNLGDDALAMWSETNPNQTPDAKNLFKFNTIAVTVLANGIAIYGGSDNGATDNVITDTVCEGGGLQASNRFQSVPIAGTTTFARNTLQRTGAPNRQNNGHNGAIWFWAEQAGINTPIPVTDTTIDDSSYAGATFWGSEVDGVVFSYVNINNAPYAFETQGPGGTVKTDHVVATGLTVGSVRSCAGLQFEAGPGNSGWNTTGNKCG